MKFSNSLSQLKKIEPSTPKNYHGWLEPAANLVATSFRRRWGPMNASHMFFCIREHIKNIYAVHISPVTCLFAGTVLVSTAADLRTCISYQSWVNASACAWPGKLLGLVPLSICLVSPQYVVCWSWCYTYIVLVYTSTATMICNQ
jgi:hypothetical protein